MSTLGIVTIGQAPRDDVVPQMRRYLPPGVRIVEAGALDGLDGHEIQEFFRPRPGDYILTTRLVSGESVVVSKEGLMPLLRIAFQRVQEAGADIVLLLCTGHLPELRCERLVVEPDRILSHIVRAFRPRRLGVVIPLPEQVEVATRRWSQVCSEVRVVPANPYGDPGHMWQAGCELRDHSPELIMMDCMGFREEHRQAIKAAAAAPTVLAHAAVSRLLAEVL